MTALAVVALLAAGIGLWAAPPPATAAAACPPGELKTANGCATHSEARAAIRALVRSFAKENGLRAALVRIDLRDRRLARVEFGSSEAGEPARLGMQLRIGSIAIPHLITMLLELQDQGQLDLDDTIDEWLPGYPRAEQITLRMLATSTSGYADWIQGNPTFEALLFENPFRKWRTRELLEVAFDQGKVCDPGTCFHYAHTNFIVIDKVIQRVTGQNTTRRIQRRVLDPLGLNQTHVSALPGLPQPVLHGYITDRGPYEDSTFWNPSWSIAKSTIMSSNLGNIVKAAKAMGRGALLSRGAAAERFENHTAGLGPFTDDFYYGLGVLVANGWAFQNPNLFGYTAIMAWLPQRQFALGLATTNRRAAAKTGDNFSQQLFAEITAYLTPNRVAGPGG